MICDGFILNSASMGSPGVEEVKWLRPVRPNDQLTLRVTIQEARASKSKANLGFVKMLCEMLNARGECVMTVTPLVMFERRNAA